MYRNNINDRISRSAFRWFPSKCLEESHIVFLVLRNEVGVSEKKMFGLQAETRERVKCSLTRRRSRRDGEINSVLK